MIIDAIITFFATIMGAIIDLLPDITDENGQATKWDVLDNGINTFIETQFQALAPLNAYIPISEFLALTGLYLTFYLLTINMGLLFKVLSFAIEFFTRLITSIAGSLTSILGGPASVLRGLIPF